MSEKVRISATITEKQMEIVRRKAKVIGDPDNLSAGLRAILAEYARFRDQQMEQYRELKNQQEG